MPVPVIMPRQGQSVESCILTKWHKKKGDPVKTGELLFSYETDKASFDEVSKEDGILLDVFYEEGDEIPVLTNVAVIGNPGETFEPGADSPSPETDARAAHEAKFKISPRARNLAMRLGLNYRLADPSGPKGRIIERDIQSLLDRGPVITPAAMDEYRLSEGNKTAAGTGLGGRITTHDLHHATHNLHDTDTMNAVDEEYSLKLSTDSSQQYEEVSLSHIRKVIAESMQRSLSSTAQLTLNTSFDASSILAYRKIIKENQDTLGLENITLNDMILYAVSRVLLNHRSLNAHLTDDKMLLFGDVHLGMAVDTERGLMVPTIFNSNKKSLNEISTEAKKLARECKKGSINPDQLKGGTFTVTNLGTLGIESFTPVLNPPQTGILGINTIIQRVREVEGKYIYYPAMGLSLTFDHRALDGAPAARFLKELTNYLENFTLMLAK